MIIAAAQIENNRDSLSNSFEKHLQFVEKAAKDQADLIFFPELSLTGYEPALAQEMALSLDDPLLDAFQALSISQKICIGIGVPTRVNIDIRISMIFFYSNYSKIIYSKQLLHTDELPYFTAGNQQVLINVNGEKLAPAICYESLQKSHINKAHDSGAGIYLASVAKPQGGVDKAFHYFPSAAKMYSMPIIMANCIGPCDNFRSVGRSSAWNKKGELVGQLDGQREGLLLFNTETEECKELQF